MAVPVHASHATVAPGSVTTLAIPVPSGVAAGDVIAAQVLKENFAAVTPPAGFTQRSEVSNTSNHHLVFWKRATGADAGTYDFTWTGATAARGSAHRISGAVAAGDPLSASDHEFSNTANANTPAVQITDTLSADTLLIWFATGFGGSSAWTQPASFTEHFQLANFTAATLGQAAQGDTGALTGSSGNVDVKTAFLGSILPAAAGPAPLASPALLIQQGLWRPWTGDAAAPDVPAAPWVPTVINPSTGVF